VPHDALKCMQLQRSRSNGFVEHGGLTMLPVVLGLKGNLSTLVGCPFAARGSLWMKALGRAMAALVHFRLFNLPFNHLVSASGAALCQKTHKGVVTLQCTDRPRVQMESGLILDPDSLLDRPPPFFTHTRAFVLPSHTHTNLSYLLTRSSAKRSLRNRTRAKI